MINVASNRFVISGTLPGGEVFSFGFRTLPSGTPQDAAALLAAVDNVVTYLGASASASLRALMHTSTVITKVAAFFYPANSDASSYQVERIINVPGTGITIHPNQTAIVVTLLTGVAGRRGKGRMFVPATGAGATGAVLSNPTPQQVATAAAALLLSPFGSNTNPVVASPTAGSAAIIAAARVDSRYDVMRSRANRQGGTTSASAVVVP